MSNDSKPFSGRVSKLDFFRDNLERCEREFWRYVTPQEQLRDVRYWLTRIEQQRALHATQWAKRAA